MKGIGQDTSQELDLDWETYRLSISEVHYEHTRWVDNFGLLLTWNTIILAVTVTSLFGPLEALPSLPPWLALILSVTGTLLAILSLLVVCRINDSVDDWYHRIRELERRISRSYVFPYRQPPFTSRQLEIPRGYGYRAYVAVSFAFFHINLCLTLRSIYLLDMPNLSIVIMIALFWVLFCAFLVFRGFCEIQRFCTARSKREGIEKSYCNCFTEQKDSQESGVSKEHPKDNS